MVCATSESRVTKRKALLCSPNCWPKKMHNFPSLLSDWGSIVVQNHNQRKDSRSKWKTRRRSRRVWRHLDLETSRFSRSAQKDCFEQTSTIVISIFGQGMRAACCLAAGQEGKWTGTWSPTEAPVCWGRALEEAYSLHRSMRGLKTYWFSSGSTIGIHKLAWYAYSLCDLVRTLFCKIVSFLCLILCPLQCSWMGVEV